MKRLFTILITLIAITLPAMGQWQGQHAQLSPDDQRRFDSYYSRWQDYRRDNNQSEVNSMERRMWGCHGSIQDSAGCAFR
jgi:hypothetical protein